ncbi:hypothetical protein HWV62_33313 [Athelia sp. TMB]|nr:hypothetical protein HWV62_33313 [Athelia sp. TMB]
MAPTRPHAKKKPGPDFEAAKAHAQRMKSRSMESLAVERESDHHAIALAGWPKRRQQPDRDEPGGEKTKDAVRSSLDARDDQADYVAAMRGWPKSNLRQASVGASSLAQAMKGWPKSTDRAKSTHTASDRQTPSEGNLQTAADEGDTEAMNTYGIITPEANRAFNLPPGNLGPITPEAERMGLFSLRTFEQTIPEGKKPLLSQLVVGERDLTTFCTRGSPSTRSPSRQMSENGIDSETSVEAPLIQKEKDESVKVALPDVKRHVFSGLANAGPDLLAPGVYDTPSTQPPSRKISEEGGMDEKTSVNAPPKQERKDEPIEIHGSDSESTDHPNDKNSQVSLVSATAEPGPSQHTIPKAATKPPSSTGRMPGFCNVRRNLIDSISNWKHEYAELWQTEFILARDFASGRHDKDKASAFLSIREAMDEGIQSLGGYSAAVLQGSVGDLKEESKMKRQAADTLRAAAKHTKGAEKAYSDLLLAIDRGFY